MIQSHSGCYPFGDDGLTKHCAPNLTEVSRYDKTQDYRLTAVVDKNHFQTPKIKMHLLHKKILDKGTTK